MQSVRCAGSVTARSSTAARLAQRSASQALPSSVQRITGTSPLGRTIRSASNSRQGHATPSTREGFRVNALDAAMPFDREHQAKKRLEAQKRLKIGIVGFGNFGQFLAARFIRNGHTVLGTSRADYSEDAKRLGAHFFQDIDDFCEEHPDVVIVASSILSTEKVLAAIPVQRLKRNTLFVDVLSVKEFPKRLMLTKLPPQVDILCTHPMFGPDSGKGSWEGLNFMYDPVRIGNSPSRKKRLANFLEIFAKEGCRMVEMSCEEHDMQAASTQFITHTVGRMLGQMNLTSTTIDTKGYESLLNLVNNTNNDSFDLYYGLFMYNQNSTQQLERLEKAFDKVRRQLFDQMHGTMHGQMFPDISNIPHNTRDKTDPGVVPSTGQFVSTMASLSDRSDSDTQLFMDGMTSADIDDEEEEDDLDASLDNSIGAKENGTNLSNGARVNGAHMLDGKATS